MKKLIIPAIILVLVAAGAGFYFYGQSKLQQPEMAEAMEQGTMEEESSETMEEKMAEAEATGSGDVMMAESQAIEASAFEFSYELSVETIKAGEPVKLTLTNTGKMPHDLQFDDFDFGTKIVQPGESETIEFTIDEAGEYAYYCSVGNHRALGMEGVLTVE